MKSGIALTLSLGLLFPRLEPSTRGAGEDFRFVLNHVLTLLEFHFGLAKLSMAHIYERQLRDHKTPVHTDLPLLLLLHQDFGDLLFERIQLLHPFANHFRRDLPMANLILAAGGMLYGRLEHLTVGFAHQRGGSVKRVG